MSLPLLLILAAAIASCGSGGGTVATAPPPNSGSNPQANGPFIEGAIMSYMPGTQPAGLQNTYVIVLDKDTQAPIDNALVTVNTVTLSYDLADETYYGNVLVALGDAVTLNVSVGGSNYSTTGTQFSSYPTISSPSPGVQWPGPCANTLSWSGGTPSAGASYLIGIMDSNDANGPWVWPASASAPWLSISTTTYQLPAGSVSSGARLANVGIARILSISGAAPGSGFILTGFTAVPITVVPDMSFSIGVTPNDAVIPVGVTQQLTATRQYCDGSNGNVTDIATWSSLDGVRAAVSDIAGSKGVVTSLASGTVSMTATVQGISGATTLGITGSTWYQSYTGTTANLYGVAGTGDKYVAVGASPSPAILTSTNGTAWSVPGVTASQALSDVVWSGSKYVAVGRHDILTSPDGDTWTAQSGGAYYHYTKSIVWTGSQYATVGDTYNMTSPDGVTWTSNIALSNFQLHSIVLYDVEWTGSQCAAVGRYGAIYLSDDCMYWTKQSSNITTDLNGIVWSGGQFVAVGAGGMILTSPTGSTWTQTTSGTTKDLFKISWSGTEYLAVGAYGTLLSSPDGVTWSQRGWETGQYGPHLNAVGWTGTKYIVVGNNGTILLSP